MTYTLALDRSAVPSHQRRNLAKAAVMDGSRNQFFAGTRFPQNQHTGICRSDHFDLREHLLERRAIPQNGTVVSPQLFLQIFVFKLESLAFFNAGEQSDCTHNLTASVAVRQRAHRDPMALAVFSNVLVFIALFLAGKSLLQAASH